MMESSIDGKGGVYLSTAADGGGTAGRAVENTDAGVAASGDHAGLGLGIVVKVGSLEQSLTLRGAGL